MQRGEGAVSIRFTIDALPFLFPADRVTTGCCIGAERMKGEAAMRMYGFLHSLLGEIQNQPSTCGHLYQDVASDAHLIRLDRDQGTPAVNLPIISLQKNV